MIESDWIQRGTPTMVPVPKDPSGGAWGFWACVSRSGATTAQDLNEGPKPFLGDLIFRISAAYHAVTQ